jgi:hypothetical protein
MTWRYRRSPRRALVVGVALLVLIGSSAVGRGAAAGHDVVRPPANGRFDYQIGGSYRPLAAVRVVDRDRTAKPATGVYNICYVNAFQTQAEQDHWWKKHHPQLLLRDRKGHPVEDPGWPGELILNTASRSSRTGLAKIEDRWLNGCKTKGFDAVEPDNLDSNTRSHHLLTRADNFAFAKLLIRHADRVGLAIAQKNSAEQSKRGKAAGFDFAIAEECQVYNECGRYTKYYGAEVFEIEYTDNGRAAYRKACRTRGSQMSIILRDRDVTPRGSTRYRYQAC